MMLAANTSASRILRKYRACQAVVSAALSVGVQSGGDSGFGIAQGIGVGWAVNRRCKHRATLGLFSITYCL
jgi:hypothetical protein